MTAGLAASYAVCRRMSRRYGTTYHWATYGLPRVKRHHVWALYGFCRYADDLVDDPALGDDTDARASALGGLRDHLFAEWRSGAGDHPVVRAVLHTAHAFDLPSSYFARFLDAMEMDLTVGEYGTYDDLLGYMDGSAAVIGEMMLPILEPSSPDALAGARDLGLAFQLTNFLRDVGEDLDRGRVYVPQSDLDRFGADPWARRVDDAWRELMEFEFARCDALYASGDAGIALLPPAEARCVRAARVLYSGIVDRIRERDYDVFGGRARVPTSRKVMTAAAIALRSGS